MYSKGEIIGGKYQVHHVLGAGAFGVVYLVYDLENKSVYALKTIKDDIACNDSVKKSFENEALVWVGLGFYPFVLPAYRVDHIDGQVFIVTDYIAPSSEGHVTLDDYIRDDEFQITTKKAYIWATEFCHGMEYATASGLKVHRDIKPSNILIDQSNFVRIADFGLAIAAGHSDGVSVGEGQQGRSVLFPIMNHGYVFGTPGYIAPEVYRREGADIRSDIYSFGLVLWQLFSSLKKFPFDVPYNGNLKQYSADIYKIQITSGPQKISSPFWEVIEKCVDNNPINRYSCFADVRNALKRIYKREGGVGVEFIVNTANNAFTRLVNSGAALKTLEYYQEALNCYDEAAKIEPDSPILLMNRANLLSKMGKKSEALDYYKRAIFNDDKNSIIWTNMGSEYVQLGKLHQARSCFQKAIDIEPGSKRAWRKLADVAMEIGDYEAVVQCCAMLLTDVNAVKYINLKGIALSNMSRHKEALYAFDEALGQFTGSKQDKAMLLTNKGNACLELGKIEDAWNAYTNAIENDSNYESTWVKMGELMEKLNRYEDAAKYYSEALRISPKQVDYWYSKGAALTYCNRNIEAMQCYQQITNLEPGDKMAWYNIGVSLVGQEKYREAIKQLEVAVKIDPEYASAWVVKAACEKEMGLKNSMAVSCRTFLAVADEDDIERISNVKDWLTELGV